MFHIHKTFQYLSINMWEFIFCNCNSIATRVQIKDLTHMLSPKSHLTNYIKEAYFL
jgi:hypothetical protein